MAKRPRMIQPGIWTNRKFLRLTMFERLLFIGLISNADDQGRLWNDVFSLKTLVFPNDPVTEEELNRGLEKLRDVGKLVRDQEGLIQYDDVSIQILGWEKHQQIRGDRYKESEIPAPVTKRQPTGEELPTGCQPSDDHLSTERQPTVNQVTTNRQPSDNQLSTAGCEENLSEQELVALKESKVKEIKRKEKEEPPGGRRPDGDFIDELLEIFCEEYERERGKPFALIARAKERNAMGKLLAFFKAEHEGNPTREETLQVFRVMFRWAVGLKEKWHFEKMSPTHLMANYNELRTLHGKRNGYGSTISESELYQLVAQHGGTA